MHAPHRIRAVVSWIAVATMFVGGVLVSTTPADAATSQTYTITTAVNIRASKSTTGKIVGVMPKGAHVRATAAAKSGWLPISYNSKTAYVSSKYAKKDAKSSSIVVTGPAGRKTALAKVPVLTHANAKATTVKTFTKGTIMKVTGQVSGLFTRVSVGNVWGWASTRSLTPSTTVIPPVVANYVATSSLSIFADASTTSTLVGSVSSGQIVGGSGAHSGIFTQVVSGDRVGWVVSGFLKATAGTDAEYVLPMYAKPLYVRTSATLRASASASGSVVGTVPMGTTLRSTGSAAGAFSSAIWNGKTAWIADSQVVATMGSTSLNRLETYGKAAVLVVRPRYPRLTSIYGWRSSSDYSTDHPNGRAVDFMIPSYKTNKAQGDLVAAYVIANGKNMHVTYVIWQQRIYTMSSGKWKAMANRGSDTANHKDHVHVSFEKSNS